MCLVASRSDGVLNLPQLPTTNAHPDNLLNILITFARTKCTLSSCIFSDDANERIGDKRHPIRHARATVIESIRDMQVRMMGCRIAQAASCSGRASANELLNVAIAPDRANIDRPTGCDSCNSEF